MVLILTLVLVIRSLIATRESRETLKQLKACLGGMDVSKDMTELVVPNNRCNDVVILNMGAFTKLKVLSIGNDCFGRVSSVKLSGLKALERVVIGENSFANSTGGLQVSGCEALRELSVGKDSFVKYNYVGVSGVPLLESLRVEEGSFRDGSELRLEGLSGLKKVEIGSDSFTSKEGDFSLRNCSSVSELRVGGGSMRLFRSVAIADVPSLKVIDIGSDCFESVSELGLIGLSGLESVVIGENSFTKKKNGYGYDRNRHFIVRNCSALTELRVGRYSFSDYSSCEIENVNALEAIEMGELNEASFNFHSASLELNGLMKLKSLLIGKESFEKCDRVVFENLPVLTSVEMGWNAFKFNDDNAESVLIVRNLTQLRSLTTIIESGVNECFGYPRHIVLENVPSLSSVILQRAFQYSDDIQLTSCECEKGFTIRCVRFFFREASDCWQW